MLRTITLLLSFSSLALAEDSLTAACKKLMAEHQDSVVNVSAVVKLNMGGGSTRGASQDRKMESAGTVIDANGLVVTSLARLDPSAMLASMRSSSLANIETALQDVKIIMGDGTEIPAQVVLKDTDLDLAFLKADLASKEAKGIKFVPVSLDDSTKVAAGDALIGLGRADDSVGRVPGVRRDYAFAVTKRPREFVLVSFDVMGLPVFAENGKLVGIGILRPGRTLSRSSLAVVSAEDVKEVAEQARNAKPAPPAKKKETAKVEAPKPETKPEPKAEAPKADAKAPEEKKAE